MVSIVKYAILIFFRYCELFEIFRVCFRQYEKKILQLYWQNFRVKLKLNNNKQHLLLLERKYSFKNDMKNKIFRKFQSIPLLKIFCEFVLNNYNKMFSKNWLQAAYISLKNNFA